MSSPPPLSFEDYEAIASAVMETERGRWFLSEFARRNRAADTGQILQALEALEKRVTAAPAQAVSAARVPADAALSAPLDGLAEAAGAVRAALTAPKPPERRVELALARLAALERIVVDGLRATGGQPAPVAVAAPRLPLPAPRPTVVEQRIAIERLEVTPPIDEAPTLVAERSAVEAALDELTARAPLPAAVPAPMLRAPSKPEGAGHAPSRRAFEPAPAKLEPRVEPLLDSLTDAEKALLFA
ncbi:hypothetical protein [Methylopila turkensis]|uniref:Uncharacterized protein n=1 Tax=Methylopila turkensis TaxID=1437816 RepID=A0A9W6JPZ9_9HYPH|nr:hypothetical protein [Methylopila turkensis]GLK81157.1 hypothetical protein GCM10008174_28980 [Methylopila turkensis]